MNYGTSDLNYDIHQEERERCECHTEKTWGSEIVDSVPIAMEVKPEETQVNFLDVVKTFSCALNLLGKIIEGKKN